MAIVHYHLCKSKAHDHQEHCNCVSENFLDDIVEHDAEVTASEGITANDDGEL